jgi:hypothetical protein
LDLDPCGADRKVFQVFLSRSGEPDANILVKQSGPGRNFAAVLNDCPLCFIIQSHYPVLSGAIRAFAPYVFLLRDSLRVEVRTSTFTSRPIGPETAKEPLTV